MKHILSFCFLLFFSYTSHACFCFAIEFCKYSESIIDNEKALVFKGTHIQSDSISYGVFAKQFKVDEIYQGEVVTVDSPFYNGEQYINTDSTVWIYSGWEESCHRHIGDEQAFFAVIYNYDFFDINEPFGYVPTSCNNDYFPISENQTVTGYITDDFEKETLELLEFEAILENGCLRTSLQKHNSHTSEFSIYPQPSSDKVTIDLPTEFKDSLIRLVDATGKEIQHVYDTELDVSGLQEGLYFLEFSLGKEVHLKRLIKI